MWAYFLIIIATDKVINFKTTLFFSPGPNGTILKLKVSAVRAAGLALRQLPLPVTAPSSCCLPHDLQRWVLLLIGSGYYIKKSRAGKHDKSLGFNDNLTGIQICLRSHFVGSLQAHVHIPARPVGRNDPGGSISLSFSTKPFSVYINFSLKSVSCLLKRIYLRMDSAI